MTAVEINTSCPNVEERGLMFAAHPTAAAEVVRAVRANTRRDVPVLAKLSAEPNLPASVQRFLGQALILVGEYDQAAAMLRKVPAPAPELLARPLADVKDPREFNLFTVPDRFVATGDAMAKIDDRPNSLQPLLDLWADRPEELNYPPDYPKMPGEPPRVQPSKKVEAHWDEDGQRVPGT